MAIFWLLLSLMAAVDVNQLLFSSEGKGTVSEKERGEEILQKLKEQKESLQLLSSHLEKEIANLEGGQGAVAKPALALDTKIQQWIGKVLFLAAITLFSSGDNICRKPLVSTVEKDRLTPYSCGKRGKEWPSLTKPFVLTRGIHVHMDRILANL